MVLGGDNGDFGRVPRLFFLSGKEVRIYDYWLLLAAYSYLL